MALQRETKSPIMNLPVRMPGQSTRERIDAILDDELLPSFLGAVLVILLAALEWYAQFTNIPRLPWL